MDARTRVDTQVVGALPLVAAMLERWGLAEIVDQVVPWEGEVPLGTLVEVLVTNRLLNPKAMYAVGAWAAQSSVTDYYGLTAEQLNDDRLGRTLERIAEHGAAVQSAATLAAVKQWRLKVKQIHYDISTAELYGAYAAARPFLRCRSRRMAVPRVAARMSSRCSSAWMCWAMAPFRWRCCR
jgi:hypothetical protein